MILIKRVSLLMSTAWLLAGGPALSMSGASRVDPAGSMDPAATTVTRGSMRGVLIPVQNLQLSSRAAGVIEKFGAEEGQVVSAGDMLVQLNADIERADVARAQAVVESTTAESYRANLELERSQKLRRDSIGSEKDLEDAQYANVLAAARRKQGVADLEMAQARLRERAVFAPIAGLVFRRTRAVGEAVERLETVVRLVDATKLELVIYAGPELLGKFKKDQNAKILVETGPARGTVVTGTISYVDPTMDPESGAFRVKISVEPSDTVQSGIAVTLQLPSEG